MPRFPAIIYCFAICFAAYISAAATSQEPATAERKDAKTNTDQGTTAKVAKSIVPVLFLNGPLLEAPMPEDPLFGQQGAEPLKDIVARLKKARDDKKVSAVVIHLGTGAAIGGAQIEELHHAIRDLRESKPVYAFADSLSFRNLALLSSASRISVAPVGDLFIHGMYGEQLFLRGLLNKLHVTPDFLTCGAYKSAAETFMRKKPSPEAEEMVNWLFDSMFDTYIEMIADGRDLSRKKVLQLVDHGLYSAKKAAELGLIDACEFRHDMMLHIENEHGEQTKLSKKYGKKKKDSLDLSNPFWMFKLWAEALAGGSEGSVDDDTVAIVYVEGPIVPGSPQPSPFGNQGIAYSDPIRRALDKAAEDDSVKAVVLRVNSPGGSAVASEIILAATRRVADKKPFVVSMGDVAGSGGYYVACGTDTIFANAATITASIGVVGGKFATHDMWENMLGITFHPIERGRNAGMMGSAEVFTQAQRNTLQSWMDEVYDDFKAHVKTSRGDRLKKPIEELAEGRVFTGEQALKLGLVDNLGTLEDATKFAAAEAGISEYKVRVIPRPKNLVEMMFKDLAGKSENDDRIRLATQPPWEAVLPLLDRLDPQRTAAVRSAIVQLELLQRESVTLMTPTYLWTN